MLKRNTVVSAAVLMAALTLTGTAMTGCSSSNAGASSGGGMQASDASPAATQPLVSTASSSEKSGNQLWAESCARCHNMRDPASYSDANWNIAVHHMRVRADLNAEDSRRILEFLKSAN
jgi:hypothetical protein